MRSTTAAAFAASIAFVVMLAGCGKTSAPVTPQACSDGVAYETALGGAPTDVALPGGVKISDCLVRNQADGDLTDVGDTLRVVATTLSEGMKDSTPTDPSEAIRAGYLVGAVESGAEGTEGIHATLVQRVTSAATNNLTPAQQADFDRGYEAGKQDG